MNLRVAFSLGMLGLWMAVFVYFLWTYPEFRDPLAGNSYVQAFWLIALLAVPWNLGRAWLSWSRKPATPPIRRTHEP